jgi:signal transduction histidine kinase
MRERLLLWTTVTACWLLMGGVWITQYLAMAGAEGQAVDVRHVLATQLASALLWVPLTVGLLWIVKRRPVVRGDVVGALGVAMLAVAGVIVLRAAAVAAFNPWLHWYPGPVPGWTELLRISAFNNFTTAWMVVGVLHAVVFAERARQAEKRENLLVQARLGSLTAQLNPHFLFNALNSTAELVHADPDAADRMLVSLGTLLRHSLRREGEQEVALAEELDLLAHYLDIEKTRLGPRLRVAMAIEKDVLMARVPPLLLQPLVENAVRHAVARRSTPGQIRIEARRDGAKLCLRVADDGCPNAAAPASTPGAGIGLRNTRERLQALYGVDHRFDMIGCAATGTEVQIELPFRTEAAALWEGRKPRSFTTETS